MSHRLAMGLVLAAVVLVAEAPLPDLRTDAAPGGSVLHVKNTASQPLTAFLIELVNYPGSSFSFSQDDVLATPVAPGGERSIPVSSMTVGAVPDYVKVQAAIYEDGSTSGVPEKVTQLIDKRKRVLVTARELIRRLEKAESEKLPTEAVADDLRRWSEGLPRANRDPLIATTQSRLGRESIAEVLEGLRTMERRLAASKPAL